MILKYSFSKGYKPTKEKIKLCDEGFIGMQNCLIEVAKTLNPLFVPFMWILTRFYIRRITNKSISYNLYLLK